MGDALVVIFGRNILDRDRPSVAPKPLLSSRSNRFRSLTLSCAILAALIEGSHEIGRNFRSTGTHTVHNTSLTWRRFPTGSSSSSSDTMGMQMHSNLRQYARGYPVRNKPARIVREH